LTSSPEILNAAYVLDTHVLLWYLLGDKKLSSQAREIFQLAQHGEATLIISAIVLAELYYIHQKRPITPDFVGLVRDLQSQPQYQFSDFAAEDVLDFPDNVAIPEMHDRIIAGLAEGWASRCSLPTR
jgi:PIN domain nuclease of toxin-antitoxin system